MWVDYKPVDDGYRSIHMMLIHRLRLKKKKKKLRGSHTSKFRFNPQFQKMTFMYQHHIYINLYP